jgi:NADH:ubiquinone oxidoreductase subunit 5 (subunit L)/multisubunit Na+/H+ antiporter MnhA subunit
VIEIMYIRADTETIEASDHQLHEAPLSMVLPTLFLGLLTFIIGLVWISGFFSPFLDAINLNFGLGGAQ